MTLIQAAILGLIQGLTEFLPISSSGHLVIAQNFFQFSEPPVSFDIFLHLATLAAVIIYFRKVLFHLNHRLVWLLCFSVIPSVIVALILKPFLDTVFTSVLFLSFGFFITAIFIFLSDRIKAGTNGLESMTPKSSLYIGIFQAIAIFPSISRSGATIYAGLRTGLNRESVVQFAFIMSIPAVLGAVIFELIGLNSTSSVSLAPTLIGMAVAFAFSFISLILLEKLVLKSRLAPFGWYSLILAIVTLIWALSSI